MCQKVYNRVLLLSNAIIITVIWDLILNLGSSLIEISVFCCCCFFFLLICFIFNSNSLEYSTQWNETSSNQKRKKSLFSFRCLPDYAVTGLVLVDVRTF